MITIQAAMLVLLGFFIASLLGLLIAPAHRARIVRLTTESLKQSMPLTEAEIRADKDRLRADYAIQLHRQSLVIDELKTSASRQLIEINRRDANISRLESGLDKLKSDLEESDNARNVLEQTVRDRLPRVEHRLAEAKKLIFQRDRDIAQLTMESEKTLRALNEAMQINAQQRAELLRQQALDVARGGTTNDALADPAFNAEIALKSEIESLREQVRDQAALISRLQGALSGAAGALETSRVRSGGRADASQGDGDVETMKDDLRALDAGERPMTAAVSGMNGATDRDRSVLLEASVRQSRAKIQDQAAEIARLAAALKAYEEGDTDNRSMGLGDSRMAMKARVGSLQGQLDVQTETIQKLRAEVASANERLARQAAHYMEEMRRLGAGTLPTGGAARRRPEPPTKRSLGERLSEPDDLVTIESGRPLAANDMSPPTRPAEAPVRNGFAARLRGLSSEPQQVDDRSTTPTTAPKPRLLDRLADLGTGPRGPESK